MWKRSRVDCWKLNYLHFGGWGKNGMVGWGVSLLRTGNTAPMYVALRMVSRRVEWNGLAGVEGVWI